MSFTADFTSEEQSAIVNLYASGLGTHRIARQLNTTQYKVQAYLKRAKLLRTHTTTKGSRKYKELIGLPYKSKEYSKLYQRINRAKRKAQRGLLKA